MYAADGMLLPGGLAFFLYGMELMKDGLRAAAGERLKGILARLAANRFVGMAAGLLATAVIQSSSAVTVMAVGFVDAGLLSLSQAVPVIMGANIGTTVTGQLIALNISDIAPLFAFAGVVLFLSAKRGRAKDTGQILLGLGLLFIGMDTMSAAFAPLQDVPGFSGFMAGFDNPFLGILAGTIMTCAIQSSSASVGILQALAGQGLIGLRASAYIIYGQNIGTCLTSVLAAAHSGKNAKRTALCHVLFNVIGTILFLLISAFLPIVEWIGALSPGDPVGQIADFNTIFNVASTAVLLPFSGWLARLSEELLPDGRGRQTPGKV